MVVGPNTPSGRCRGQHGTFGLGFGEDPATRQPNVDFDFRFQNHDGTDEDELTIVHDGGETATVADGSEAGPIAAGERYRRYATEPGTAFERATVRIVYRPEDGTRSYVLATWRGPEAEA